MMILVGSRRVTIPASSRPDCYIHENENQMNNTFALECTLFSAPGAA
jgi:hypothetical protein